MSRRSMLVTFVLLLIPLPGATAWAGDPPRMMRSPTLNRTHIVFALGGHLWSVPRSGGEARPLTSGEGVEADPHFSPDGTQVAFTGVADGSREVYVMPAEGGVPRRLTYHPEQPQLLGWTPDGKRVLYSSLRNSYSVRLTRLFTVGAAGGPETELPLPMGNEASFSPDGAQLAYVPTERKSHYFQRYRGGRTTPIWIARLVDGHITPLPHGNYTDCNPLWIGDRVYFLSDRDGPVTLFVYDLRTRRVSRCVENHGFDLKSAAAGPGAIVYEQLGSLHLYDLASGATREVPVRVSGDFPELREHTRRVASVLQHARLAPAGERALFEARGEILALDAEGGAVRNLTDSPGVMERDPAWSPDGKRVAYFSDESGEYALHLRSAAGEDGVEKIDLGRPPSFYYSPRWSPDGARIAFTDRRGNIWYVDRDRKQPVRAAHGEYGVSAPVWAPDSRWLAYSMRLQNRLSAIFLYSLQTGKSTQITDGRADATAPAFDHAGGCLYFLVDPDAGGKRGGGLATSRLPVRRSLFAALLRRDVAFPPAAAGGSEGEGHAVVESAARSPAEEGAGRGRAAIDLEGIRRRILPLRLPARPYTAVHDGGPGALLLLERVAGSIFEAPEWAVHRFNSRTGQSERLLERVSAFDLSPDGAKMLYRQGNRWAISPTSAPPLSGAGTLATERLAVRVVPREQWRQMYHEEWRIVRDWFYDPGLHGLDPKAVEARYAPFVEGLTARAELGELFRDMLGELSASHVSVQGGDMLTRQQIPGGLLGADYAIQNGRYRFARIYGTDPWNPASRAPLAQPGAEVAAGEYLLAVNGQELTASDNVYRLFEGTAGKPTAIRVGGDPAGAGARQLTVTPLGSEFELRMGAWIEQNRETVDRLTRGCVAYIYVPDTLEGGFDRFSRQFYAQTDKEAAIIDARFNLGGALPGAIVDALGRSLLSLGATRDEAIEPYPPGIYGPKVLLINEYAGSGGDALALYFRERHLGTLVGKRTWGGLAGAFDIPSLMDGGVAEVPTTLLWGPGRDGQVENRGVAPDIEVEYDPEQLRQGHDPQLEAAVRTVMAALRKNPPAKHAKGRERAGTKGEVGIGGDEGDERR